MRLKNIPGAREAVQTSRYVVQTPETFKGQWREVFGMTGPLFIEVGMGKGRFLMEMAEKYPEICFAGIEMYDSVLIRALQKMDELALSGRQPANLKFLRLDARLLPEVFGPGEVDRIYLNFSDPWPKARHDKRRLTSRIFLKRYEQILSPAGSVEFKTDNRTLFDFSLEEAEAAGWIVKAFTFDLHHDPEMYRDNVMTEYEEKFSSMGNPICKMIMTPPLEEKK